MVLRFYHISVLSLPWCRIKRGAPPVIDTVKQRDEVQDYSGALTHGTASRISSSSVGPEADRPLIGPVFKTGDGATEIPRRFRDGCSRIAA